jgi:hypothetical protein
MKRFLTSLLAWGCWPWPAWFSAYLRPARQHIFHTDTVATD